MSLKQSDGAAGAQDAHAEVFDAQTFQEFIDLMGPTQAAKWLDGFRDGLNAEFGTPADEPRETAKSRADIHNFCARAGLIGLPALYDACRIYLECHEGPESVAAAYQRVRIASQDALCAIKGPRTRLG